MYTTLCAALEATFVTAGVASRSRVAHAEPRVESADVRAWWCIRNASLWVVAVCEQRQALYPSV